MPWWRRTRPTAWPHTRSPTIEEGQLNDQVLEAAKRLSAAGIDSARLDARLLWAQADGDAARFEALVQRRLSHEPVAYITGRKEFWSLDFTVGPGVLVPRPDTETLIEEAMRLIPDRTGNRFGRDPRRRAHRVSQCHRHRFRILAPGPCLRGSQPGAAGARPRRHPAGGLGCRTRPLRPGLLQSALHPFRRDRITGA